MISYISEKWNDIELPTAVENKVFAEDVFVGLSSSPRFLSSKYFYDKRGDELFQKIMKLDEYYPTRCEYEVLNNNKRRLFQLFSSEGTCFDMVEFGAGDGMKTKVLLEEFLKLEGNFVYFPIDISNNVLDLLRNDLDMEFPELKVNALHGDYFEMLEALNKVDKNKKVVLFLGSNIGNFPNHRANIFLSKLHNNLNLGDMLLIGFDLKKTPEVILSAYNDKNGITRDFNLNLLNRINNELGGNFNLEKFIHYPIYNPQIGEAQSYLVSKENQVVHIEAFDTSFEFIAWETIHTEISKKYDLPQVEKMARNNGFKVVEHLFDKRGWYLNSVWEVI